MNKINYQITIVAKTILPYSVVNLLVFSGLVFFASHAIAQKLCASVFAQNPPSTQHEATHPIEQKLNHNNDFGMTYHKATKKSYILSQELSIVLQDNIENYQYQKGYITIADIYFEGNLTKTFRIVSSILGPIQFKKLRWKEFHGTTKDFDNIQKNFLDEYGMVRKEFIGLNGQIHCADKYFNGYMIKTFINISAVFGAKKVKEIGWKFFNGTTKDVRHIQNTLLDTNGHIVKDYIGMSGFALFAEFYFNNNMSKTFRNVKVVIGVNKFKDLKWKIFMGTTKDFDTTYNIVVDNDGNIKKEAIGSDGLAHIAKEHFSGSIGATYTNISAVLDKHIFHQLKWTAVNGHTKNYQIIKNVINSFNSVSMFIKKYKDMDGFVHLANQYFNGNLNITYNMVFLILQKKQFKKLAWQYNRANIKNHNLIRENIFDKNGHIREEFIGSKGYSAFADLYTNGYMIRAFIVLTNILGSRKAVEEQLKWKEYLGNTTHKFKIQQKLFKDETHILQFIKQYAGREGHIAYADKYHEGNLRRAKESVQYFLNKEHIQQLKWKKFLGNTEQLKSLINDFKQYYPHRWQGISNQKRIADKIFNGYLHTTYRSVLSAREYLFDSDTNTFINFKALNWSPTKK